MHQLLVNEAPVQAQGESTMPINPAGVMDVLPERFPYRDEGCELSPSCLHCPLPQCKYDDPGWYQREQRRERDTLVMAALWNDGLSVPQAAARFSLSQRTVFRILKQARPRRMERPPVLEHARAV
jgi:hypothetical protein